MIEIVRSNFAAPEWYNDRNSNASFDDALKVEVNWEQIPIEAKPKVEALITLILTMISALVDNENSIALVVHANHRRACVTATVHQDDVGFALGQRGQHADAMRTVLIALCKKLSYHFDLDISGPTVDTTLANT